MARLEKSLAARDILVTKEIDPESSVEDTPENPANIDPAIKKPVAQGQILAPTAEQVPLSNKPFPFSLPEILELVLGQDDKAHAVFHDQKNDYVLLVGSRALDLKIRFIAESEGKILRRSDLSEINEYLQAFAEMNGERVDVFYRVRPVENGVELDVGDAEHTRVRITAGLVEVL
jgi:hypothetical protein